MPSLSYEVRKRATLKWRAKNRDRLRVQSKARSARRSKTDAKYLAAKARWRETHRDQLRAAGRRRYAEQRDRIIEQNGRGKNLRRTLGTYALAEWRDLVALYHGRCAYCGQQGRVGPDHIVPVAAGGTNDIDNIVPACAPCNRSKNRYPLIVFLARKAA